MKKMVVVLSVICILLGYVKTYSKVERETMELSTGTICVTERYSNSDGMVFVVLDSMKDNGKASRVKISVMPERMVYEVVYDSLNNEIRSGIMYIDPIQTHFYDRIKNGDNWNYSKQRKFMDGLQSVNVDEELTELSFFEIRNTFMQIYLEYLGKCTKD